MKAEGRGMTRSEWLYHLALGAFVGLVVVAAGWAQWWSVRDTGEPVDRWELWYQAHNPYRPVITIDLGDLRNGDFR